MEQEWKIKMMGSIYPQDTMACPVCHRFTYEIRIGHDVYKMHWYSKKQCKKFLQKGDPWLVSRVTR